MSYESDKKDDKRVKIFWLIMVSITVIMLGLKLCNVCNLYNVLYYKLVFLPIYGPILIAVGAIVLAVFNAIFKILLSLFRKK